jgi:hypothetical protein
MTMRGAEWIGWGDSTARCAPWEGHDGVSHAQAACLAVVMLLVGIGVACAEPAFFARKTITVTIGYSAGGSYDLYGRLLARHLGKHISKLVALMLDVSPSVRERAKLAFGRL